MREFFLPIDRLINLFFFHNERQKIEKTGPTAQFYDFRRIRASLYNTKRTNGKGADQWFGCYQGTPNC